MKSLSPSAQFFRFTLVLGHWTTVGLREFLRGPRWLKLLAGMLAVALAVSILVTGQVEQRAQKKGIFDQLYPYYYSVYIQTQPKHLAEYYASYYAKYYADYYSSSEYESALQFALPEATPRAFNYPKASPVARLGIGVDGLELVKTFEGFRSTPYLDQGGKLTVGYGHLVRRGEIYTSLSVEDAENILLQDIMLAEAVVKRSVRVPLHQRQFSALVSLVYNIGSDAFEQSTLLKYINNNDHEAAAAEFERWDKVGKNRAPGLTRRRIMEKRLYMS